MQTKLLDTTATRAIGRVYSKKLLRVVSGEYSLRLVALIASSSSTIELQYSDPPYNVWSTPQTVITDASLGSFDCLIDENGDIYVVYPETSTNYLVNRKLAFSSGSWTPGGKITIYNGTQCFDPSLSRENTGTLWVAYASFSSPIRTIYVKSSTDGGLTWGSGSTDAGNNLGASVNAWVKVLVGLNTIFAFTTLDTTRISMFTRPISGGSWSSENVISTGSGFDDGFDAALREDGLIGLVVASNKLFYREYDGVSWSQEIVISNVPEVNPTLIYKNNFPVIFYYELFYGAQAKPMISMRQSTGFSTPVNLDLRVKEFDKVLLYDSISNTYSDRTNEAISHTVADMFHPSTSALVNVVGDQILLGNSASFRYVHFVLSTVGVGGTLQFSYWNGSEWVSFTPESGGSSLSNSQERILLWNDYDAIPADWQKKSIESSNLYYLKIEVVSNFTTAPIGTIVSPISIFTQRVIER